MGASAILLKNKNAQKRFLRLNTKEFVVSQAKFLVMRSYSVRVISKYPLSPKK